MILDEVDPLGGQKMRRELDDRLASIGEFTVAEILDLLRAARLEPPRSTSSADGSSRSSRAGTGVPQAL